MGSWGSLSREGSPSGLDAARKQIVEPVSGLLKHVRGFHKFLARDLRNVSGEWNLQFLTHNRLKVWRSASSVTGA